MASLKPTCVLPIREVLRDVPAVSPETNCGEVYRRMVRDSQLPSVAIVENGFTIGLVSRQTLMKNFSYPVTHALYESRPAHLLMKTDPFTVDIMMPVDQVTEKVAASDGAALEDGILLVEDGRYAGLCSAHDLLNLTVRQAREQIADLNSARQEAERASRAKSRLLANLSHELRTPMNAIIGFSDMVRMGMAGAVNSKQKEYMDDVANSGKRLLNLINDILDISRAEAGKLELNEVSFALEDLIDETCRMLMLRAQAKNIRLSCSLSFEPVVFGDEGKLLQVLINIVNNAVKFTPSGGSVTLDVQGQADGGIRIMIRDTGVGIAREDIERIFEPFDRGHGAYTRHSEGAGIGLALAKVLVEMHDGRLFLESEIGHGTTATICLPAERVLSVRAKDCAAAG